MRASIAVGLGRHSGPFYALSALIILAFLMGGGSRADISSLIILRPAAALFLGYGLWGLKKEQIREHRFLFGMAAAIISLVIVQLIPLPVSVWSALPGRDLIVEIDRAAGLGDVWRPISLVPRGTWNAFFALLVPGAILVLGARLSAGERAALLPLLLCLGLLSSVLAILQLAGPKDGPLYLYDVTSTGTAVGLFANRNHQAAFLASLIPMLAVFASPRLASSIDIRLRTIFALGFAALLVPLLLVTGSRAGLVTGGLALLTAPLVYRSSSGRSANTQKANTKKRKLRGLLILIGLLGIAGLALVTITVGRAESIDRAISGLAGPDVRYRAWQPVMQMLVQYFPFGSGMGSFREIFRVVEPRDMLTPLEFNHAHNDWLEAILTGGLAAAVLMLVAIGAFFRKTLSLILFWRTANGEHVLACGAGVILMLLVTASITDYPLRVPSLESLFVVAAIWMSTSKAQSASPKQIDGHVDDFKQGRDMLGGFSDA